MYRCFIICTLYPTSKMSSNKRKADTLDVETQAAKLSKKRAHDSELRRQWRPINLDNESFHLPKAESLNRHSTFNLRRCTLSGIFLKFVTPALISKMALDMDSAISMFDDGTLSSTLPSIFKLLAIWIRIYGEQHQPKGVQRGQRPLRSQLYFYQQHFLSVFPNIRSIGLRFMEIMTTHFLFDSRYSKQLSHNFRMILRGWLSGCWR